MGDHGTRPSTANIKLVEITNIVHIMNITFKPALFSGLKLKNRILASRGDPMLFIGFKSKVLV